MMCYKTIAKVSYTYIYTLIRQKVYLNATSLAPSPLHHSGPQTTVLLMFWIYIVKTAINEKVLQQPADGLGFALGTARLPPTLMLSTVKQVK